MLVSGRTFIEGSGVRVEVSYEAVGVQALEHVWGLSLGCWVSGMVMCALLPGERTSLNAQKVVKKHS